MSSSTAPSRRCEDCGALPRAEADRYCAYCGAALPVPATPPPPPTPRETTARRFALLEQHRDTQRFLADPPSGTDVAARTGGGVLATLVIAGCIVAFALAFMNFSASTRPHIVPAIEGLRGFDGFPGAPAPRTTFRFIGVAHTVIPLLVVAGAVFMAIKTFREGTRVASSPVRSSMALVVDEHREQRGARDHGRTVHVATFEDPRGRRSSYVVPAAAARELARGDMGVLHARGPAFIEFDRVDV